jgi:hypothetical protein
VTRKFIFFITSTKWLKLNVCGIENGLCSISPLLLNEFTIIRKNGNAKVIKAIIKKI